MWASNAFYTGTRLLWYSKSTQFLAQRNIVLGNDVANTPLDFDCSPLSVVAVGSNRCTQRTVCCADVTCLYVSYVLEWILDDGPST
ncbi:hypothetical protein OG21DRAFT_1510774 [Imleria badia]|nr:hypothetical protein OG21DRAFT_1510774 [Imleria badia]